MAGVLHDKICSVVVDIIIEKLSGVEEKMENARHQRHYGDTRDAAFKLIKETDGHPRLILVISVNYNAPTARKIDKTPMF
ncbi:hypothetical protein SLS58_009199 [Diplodia intermedia]|uniref:Uncharacterized protein n=1 Tax=Diplodia intermedia TaxID=856260 RepID=A0ABR3TDQ1_9PEZI